MKRHEELGLLTFGTRHDWYMRDKVKKRKTAQVVVKRLEKDWIAYAAGFEFYGDYDTIEEMNAQCAKYNLLYHVFYLTSIQFNLGLPGDVVYIIFTFLLKTLDIGGFYGVSTIACYNVELCDRNWCNQETESGYKLSLTDKSAYTLWDYKGELDIFCMSCQGYHDYKPPY